MEITFRRRVLRESRWFNTLDSVLHFHYDDISSYRNDLKRASERNLWAGVCLAALLTRPWHRGTTVPLYDCERLLANVPGRDLLTVQRDRQQLHSRRHFSYFGPYHLDCFTTLFIAKVLGMDLKLIKRCTAMHIWLV